jgi:hypothetical protein
VKTISILSNTTNFLFEKFNSNSNNQIVMNDNINFIISDYDFNLQFYTRHLNCVCTINPYQQFNNIQLKKEQKEQQEVEEEEVEKKDLNYFYFSIYKISGKKFDPFQISVIYEIDEQNQQCFLHQFYYQ